MSNAFHFIWREQCEAARGIQQNFGIEKALGYLIGEKLVSFVRTADDDEDFAGELPKFVAEVKEIFGPHQIRNYFDTVRRIGPMAHTSSDEEYEFIREHGMIKDDPVRGAEDILIMERIREMLV